MITFSNIILTVLIILWSWVSVIDPIVKKILSRSSSKYTRWVRKMCWDKIINDYKTEDICFNDHKLKVFLVQYLRNSKAAKTHYINNGHDSFRYHMLEIIEEYQRMLEKYKYNSFDKLDYDEERFINSWLDANPKFKRRGRI